MVEINWTSDGPGIARWEAGSAQEFLAAIRRSNPMWWDEGRCPWVFRGHAETSWDLLPSAWRPGQAISAALAEAQKRFEAVSPSQRLIWEWPPVQSGAKVFKANDADTARRLAVSTTSELLLIWDFILGCNDLGLSVPLFSLPPDPAVSPNWLWFPEFPLLADEFSNYSDLPATIALAQHHGIPTRYLDWTANPIAAAFFAVEKLFSIKPNESIVFWSLHRQRAQGVSISGVEFPNGPSGAGRLDPSLAVVRPPAGDNKYLTAQSGLFTTINFSGIHFMQTGGLRASVDSFVAQSNAPHTVLRKITLSHQHVPNLKELLEREQISRAALMPTRDNVAADVLRRWQSRTRS